MDGFLAPMKQLVAELQPYTERPVTWDARNLAPLPAVLVMPPTIDANDPQLLCGEMTYTFDVLLVGTPGVGAELTALDALVRDFGELEDVLLWEPTAFVPYGSNADMPPAQAYRLRVQRFY